MSQSIRIRRILHGHGKLGWRVGRTVHAHGAVPRDWLSPCAAVGHGDSSEAGALTLVER